MLKYKIFVLSRDKFDKTHDIHVQGTRWSKIFTFEIKTLSCFCNGRISINKFHVPDKERCLWLIVSAFKQEKIAGSGLRQKSVIAGIWIPIGMSENSSSPTNIALVLTKASQGLSKNLYSSSCGLSFPSPASECQQSEFLFYSQLIKIWKGIGNVMSGLGCPSKLVSIRNNRNWNRN